MQNSKRARALVVDDELYIQDVLKTALEDAGYDCIAVGNAERALEELAARPVDIVLVDIRMPGMSGMELVQGMKSRRAEVVIVVITALDSAAAAVEAIRAGASDYLVKPFSLDCVVTAVNHALERRRLENEAQDYRKFLEQVAEERAAETRRMFYCMTRVLVRLFELKSPYKSGHPLKVAEMSRYVAHEMRMTEDGVRKVYLAGLLADVGMIAVHEDILTKKDMLTDDEYRRIQGHIQMTEEVLKPILEDQEVLKFIRHHHERYDGTGYPDGLRGNLIPLGSRIIAVVESFAAMTQDRPYRSPLSAEEAIGELFRCRESQFDPNVVSVFTDLHESTFRNLDKSRWVLP